MPYETIEASIEQGRPVALYEFVFGTVTWRYTSADEDLTVAGQVWKRAAIRDDGVRQTGESATDALQITAPGWIGPAQIFMQGSPSQPIMCYVRMKHEGDAEVRVVYSGEISQINYPLPGQCRITCETTSATMRREGLRLGWQRSCPYTVYDPLTCQLSKAAWGTAFTVTAISGLSVSLSLATARSPTFLNLGFMEWTHPTRGVEYVALDITENDTASTTVVLTALELPSALYVGATGTVYPGCDFTPARCQSFSNYENYGGMPSIPGRSPFDGNPVFY